MPELEPEPKLRVPSARRVRVVSPGSTEMRPPAWFTVRLPSSCTTAKPARPRRVKLPEASVRFDLPINEVREPLLAKSSSKVPPKTDVVPV